MSKPMNTPINEDCIELGLPVNPAYVSSARLTASSIANRMRFDIEDIEDIKAAVSEACTYLIKIGFRSISTSKMFKIQFYIKDGSLEIDLTSDIPEAEQSEEDELGMRMIEALMDHIQVNRSNANVKIHMVKKLH